MEISSLCLHKDPKIFNLNELEYRSYFIPYESKEVLSESRERSAYYTSLCGEWLFKYAESAYYMPDFVTNEEARADFKAVSLPEMWQLHGEDYAQYQTSPYTFIFNPPYPPTHNPCAAYVKSFDISPKENKNYELHFEGKDSCIYVWLNGSFVGYGEAPHQDSAFDITPYLKNGKNTLCVLVFKWCSGSYIDDQDKIRLSGIFRDVYILERAKNGIKDFSVSADMYGSFSLEVSSPTAVSAALYDKDGKEVFFASVNGRFDFTVKDVHLWSAEEPYLYTLVLSCDGEFIRQRVGFRTSKTENGVYTVNGKAVKLYGVNRHDLSPDSGYAVSYSYIKDELTLMKKFNINAIRTAHYPNDPRFYELCDELGFYIMCEADQECHGVQYVNGWDAVVEHEQFEAAFVDRMARMYEAFKNFPCIVIWSLGNESGWGKNLEKCVDYFNEKDRSRPLHYQAFTMRTSMNVGEEDNTSPVFTPELDRYINKNFGMTVLGYPTLAKLRAMIDNKSITLPIVFHEYSHAMGNSCGDLRFYDDIIQKCDRCMGGFIWEWCDQALRLTDEQGREFFGYGGDFGEKHHLLNVCMDGLVSPDRVPHSSLLEAGACFSPIKINRISEREYEIFNRNFFVSSDRYSIRYEIVADGRVISSGDVDTCIEPRQRQTVTVNTESCYDARNAIIRFFVALKESTEWAERGHVVYKNTFELACRENKEDKASATPILTETNSEYTVYSGGLEYVIRKDKGVICNIRKEGKELLASPMEFCVWRMPTDNDVKLVGNVHDGIAEMWHKTYGFGELPYPWLEVFGLCATEKDGKVVIGGDFIFAVPGRHSVSRGHIEYCFDGKALAIRQTGKINEKFNFWLPRYGYRFKLTNTPNEVNYFGFGPEECYEDKREYASLDWYGYTVDDDKNSYEKPQECNSRVDTKWLDFSTQGVGFDVSADKFSFCVTSHDATECWQYAHKKDMPKTQGAYLHIDYRMSGVGSKSCGGDHPQPECRIGAGEKIDFTVVIKNV